MGGVNRRIMKFLVTAGCSFTSHHRVNIHRNDTDFLNDWKQFYYYPHWLQIIKPELKVFNMGNPGNSNKLIAKSAIYKLKELINLGINGEEIGLIVEWSNYHRRSYFVSNEIKEKYPYDKLKDYANDYISNKDYIAEKGYWLTFACPDMNYSSMEHISTEAFNFNQNYFKTLYNDEERFIEWLDYFDYLINFCELHKIKLKCFFMNNPFSQMYGFGLLPNNYKTFEEMVKGLFVDKLIHNTWNEKRDNIIKIFTNSEYLFNGIDWDKYCWFFDEEGISKNGGVLEWTIRNQIESTDKNFNPLYQEYESFGSQSELIKNMLEGKVSCWGHTSSCNYKKFTEDVILKWEMFKYG